MVSYSWSVKYVITVETVNRFLSWSVITRLKPGVNEKGVLQVALATCFGMEGSGLVPQSRFDLFGRFRDLNRNLERIFKFR